MRKAAKDRGYKVRRRGGDYAIIAPHGQAFGVWGVDAAWVVLNRFEDIEMHKATCDARDAT